MRGRYATYSLDFRFLALSLNPGCRPICADGCALSGVLDDDGSLGNRDAEPAGAFAARRRALGGTCVLPRQHLGAVR